MACGLAEGTNPSYFLFRGGSPAAWGRDDVGRRLEPPDYEGREDCAASGWVEWQGLPTVALQRGFQVGPRFLRTML